MISSKVFISAKSLFWKLNSLRKKKSKPYFFSVQGKCLVMFVISKLHSKLPREVTRGALVLNLQQE